jgi:hypothetical protein
MRKLYALMDRVKDTDVSLLVTGESGTGKEVVARAVHDAGARARRPSSGLNCGAIPANLLESELFGTRARRVHGRGPRRKGLFREAEGGTILLDEIGEMPSEDAGRAAPDAPGEDGKARRVGTQEEPSTSASSPRRTATSAQMVAEGTFREDLFYRLNVVELHDPAAPRARRTTSRRSSITFSDALRGPLPARTKDVERATRFASCAPTTGRATCASSSTRSHERVAHDPPPRDPASPARARCSPRVSPLRAVPRARANSKPRSARESSAR